MRRLQPDPMLKKNFSLKSNIIANFAGSIWTALFSIIFVPLYLPYIGIEAYGLIGVFTSLQAFIMLLDFGLSPTLNRELARLSALPDQSQAMHNLKRTLEIPNWICALFIAAFLSTLSPFIAKYWIQPKTLSTTTITHALILMSVSVAVQFSAGFYVGGLMGLQKQVYLNLINIISSTLRSAGAFLVVALVSPTIQAFLVWQTFVAVFQLCLVFVLLKYSLPSASEKGTFEKESLKKIWRFATGMTGITVVSLILTQTDKIILSRMLSLEGVGYYTLSITISGMAVATIVSSITHSVYPKFSRLVSVGDEAELKNIYHRSCQMLSAILIPIVAIIAVFSYEILLLWTRDAKIAANTNLLLSFVVIGTGLNGLVWLPYHLQLAYGWTKLGFYVNLAAIFILVPLIIVGVYKYGALGGAAAFVLLNIGYILVNVQVMHRRYLKGEQWKWYFEDLLPPLLISVFITIAGKYFFSADWSKVIQFLYLGLILSLSLAGAVLIQLQLRNLVMSYIIKVFGTKISV